MHQADAMDGGDGKPWLPDTARYSDRMAASIVNAQLPYVFSTSALGFVRRPSVFADGGLWCSCSSDCNSMGSGGHGCDNERAFHGDQLKKMMEQKRGSMQWCPCVSPSPLRTPHAARSRPQCLR